MSVAKRQGNYGYIKMKGTAAEDLVDNAGGTATTVINSPILNRYSRKNVPNNPFHTRCDLARLKYN